jgi:hypothetical protein
MGAGYLDKFDIEVLGITYHVYEYESFSGIHYECHIGDFDTITIVCTYLENNSLEWTENGTDVTNRSKAIGTAIENHNRNNLN